MFTPFARPDRRGDNIAKCWREHRQISNPYLHVKFGTQMLRKSTIHLAMQQIRTWSGRRRAVWRNNVCVCWRETPPTQAGNL